MTTVCDDAPVTLVKTPEAAKAVGVSARTLLNWREAGRVSAVYRTPGRRGQYMWDPKKLRAQLGIEENES